MVGVNVRLWVQTSQQYPAIVSESFAGSAEPDPAIAVFSILADVVEVKIGSGSTAHWTIHFIRLNGWLRLCFAQLITLLDIDGIGQNWEDSNIKRDGLQAQVPPEQEMMLSTAVIKRRMRESTTALRARFKGFGVPQFLQNVNDLRVTLVTGVTLSVHETRALGPARPNPIDVYYVSDMTPANEDGRVRSLGDSACVAEPEPLLSSK